MYDRNRPCYRLKRTLPADTIPNRVETIPSYRVRDGNMAGPCGGPVINPLPAADRQRESRLQEGVSNASNRTVVEERPAVRQ